MPPKNKSRNDDARARAQARREALARQERNRRLGFIGLWSTLGLVVVVVVAFVVVLQVKKGSDTTALNKPVSAALANDLATIPTSAYSGVGTALLESKTVNGLTKQSGTAITTDGKPTVVYFGGEFCPYCAVERWALASSLARFGTFSGLETTRSAGNDGDYATITFLHSSYTSDYVAFTPYEILDRAQKSTGVTPSADASASFKKYDPNGGVPFFSINNAYTGSSQIDPTILGKTNADKIAAALKDPSSNLSKNILQASNVITAAICTQTKQQPSNVCSASEVTAAAQYLSSAGSSGSSGTG